MVYPVIFETAVEEFRRYPNQTKLAVVEAHRNALNLRYYLYIGFVGTPESFNARDRLSSGVHEQILSASASHTYHCVPLCVTRRHLYV